jgi:hypothetical protein
MAKYHARPSLQYRYEHYDPRFVDFTEKPGTGS